MSEAIGIALSCLLGGAIGWALMAIAEWAEDRRIRRVARGVLRS